MPGRTRRWKPSGAWLRAARLEAGLTQEQLAARTGISVPSLSRFETDRAQPGFSDVCVISLALGWPLLYFATGRERHGEDTNALVTELRFWGLRDLLVADSVLLGEVRSFEDVLAAALSGAVNPRVLEALPALLLRNPYDPESLLRRTDARDCLRRAGWISDVALEISRHLPSDSVHPEAHERLERMTASAWKSPPPEEPDSLGRLQTRDLLDRVWAESPPLTRRWRIACGLGLDDFTDRARSLLLEAHVRA